MQGLRPLGSAAGLGLGFRLVFESSCLCSPLSGLEAYRLIGSFGHRVRIGWSCFRLRGT